MSRSRSPNYPSISLGTAIEAIKEVYAKEKRAHFPRTSLAGHLGYSSINGRSLARIGAIRAYRLIEGREDDLAVSQTAIAILEAPEGSPDRAEAYRTAFLSPTIFKRIHDKYGDETPSHETLRWWLTQQGYVGDASDKTLKSYLASLRVVNAETEGYLPVPPEPDNDGKPDKDGLPQSLDQGFGVREVKPARRSENRTVGLEVGTHERVLQAGLLSKGASYRVLVTGHVGKAEFDKLIAKLQMDEDILADEDDATFDEDRDPLA